MLFLITLGNDQFELASMMMMMMMMMMMVMVMMEFICSCILINYTIINYALYTKYHRKKIKLIAINDAQKMKFSIKDFFSKCDQIRRKLRIWSYLLKISLMENFIFCAVK